MHRLFTPLTLILFLTFPFNPLFAQSPTGIKGRITDKTSSKSIEYATITVMRSSDSLVVNGGITDSTGNFIIVPLDQGMYRLKISFVAYQDRVVDSVVLKAGEVKDLGVLALKTGVNLDEFKVVEERGIVQYGADKKVYNVDKDLINKGGTATDVLGNIPSVQVDADRNITFRGSGNVRILIDGKPSALSSSGAILDQIPAENIERIEIISNPSAKYDAEGTTGIINIITKKGSKKGMSGNVSFNAGTGDKYNGNLLLNYGKGRSNWSFNYGWQQMNVWSYGNSFRTTSFDSTVSDLWQENNGYRQSQGHNAKLSYDFNLNTKNTLSASAGFNIRNRGENEKVDYRFMDGLSEVDSFSTRLFDEGSINNNFDAYMGWTKTFTEPEKKLSAEANWSQSAEQEGLSAIQTYTSGKKEVNRPSDRQNTHTVGGNYIGTFQLDYTDPLKKGKLETGVKAIIRLSDNDFSSEFYDNGSESFVYDTRISNHFVYREKVASAYATYSNRWKRFDYNVGLRYEHTFYSSDQLTTKQFMSRDYPGIFPSAFVKYEIKKGRELQLGYSRRIRRPDLHDLNPFPEYEDPYNLRMGNPYLRPEFIDSYEGTYMRSGKKSTVSVTAYMRYTHENITRFRRITPEGVTLTSTENLNNSRSLGFEFVTNFDLYKWWKINFNGNLYNMNQNASGLQSGLTANVWGGNGRLMNNFKIGKTIDAQLSYNYYQPGWALQGTIKPFQAMDIAMRKSFWKDQASISIRVSDVLNTRQFSIHTLTPDFSQEYIRKRESRIFNVTFSYRFGKDTLAPKKGKRGGGGEGEMMEDF